MRLLALVFLVFGLGLAGGAIYFAMEYFDAKDRSAGPVKADTVVVVAAHLPLKFGDRLTYGIGKKVFKFINYPKGAVPKDAFRTAQEIFGEKLDKVRIVTRAMEPGELVLKSKVTGFGGSVRMATKVKEGMRAFTIPINNVSGGGGLISPGDRVDIQYITNTSGRYSSHILMQNVLVVATDQRTDVAMSRTKLATTATVEVTPPDAQKLTLAQETGKLTLLLRGISEAAPSNGNMSSVDVSQLPGAPVKKEPKPVAPVVERKDKGYKVILRKGGTARDVRFE